MLQCMLFGGMTSVQVRNVPEEIVDALRTEAEEHGRSLQQHLLAVLDEHTARTRRQALFHQLDAVLGEAPILTADPADAVRADRDARDAERSEEHE